MRVQGGTPNEIHQVAGALNYNVVALLNSQVR